VKTLYPRLLAIVGDVTRSMLTAAPGRQLVGADFSSVESRVLSWAADEAWKLDAYARYDVTGNEAEEVYRVIGIRMLGKPLDSITKDDRQIGKQGDLSLGYAGGPNALKKALPHLTDDQRQRFVWKWREEHPRTTALWDRAGRRCVECHGLGKACGVLACPLPARCS
jgi:DNA polymerase